MSDETLYVHTVTLRVQYCQNVNISRGSKLNSREKSQWSKPFHPAFISIKRHSIQLGF
ncbi:hypothetical protein NUKP55_14420 [Klebsiella variicola]|nr:hypothetical protein NUKP55_14420 [Klebsiella variicola]